MPKVDELRRPRRLWRQKNEESDEELIEVGRGKIEEEFKIVDRMEEPMIEEKMDETRKEEKMEEPGIEEKIEELITEESEEEIKRETKKMEDLLWLKPKSEIVNIMNC